MMRFAGRTNEGKPFVVLGLDPQNMDRLREGQPIAVNLRKLDPDGEPIEELPDLDLMIVFAGKDEMAWLRAKFSTT